MLKTDLIQVVNGLNENQKLVLIEFLDAGFQNKRFMSCSKEHLLEILDLFDENLYGHVRDFVYTTIVGYEIIEQ